MDTERRMRVILEVDYNLGGERFKREEFNNAVMAKIHAAFPAVVPAGKSMRLSYLATENADEPQKLNHRVRA